MPSSEPSWTLENAAQTYGIAHWGDGFFAINAAGHVTVRPDPEREQQLDLCRITRELPDQNLGLPVLLRFTDILKTRVRQLQQAFDRARADYRYAGSYTPIYPIKVNQQRQVIESLLSGGQLGLEAGSKPELLATLALSRHNWIICNGYKDRAYIRLALIGLRMGHRVYIVIEKPSELDLIVEESKKLGIAPLLGVRVRLSSISAGKWQNTGGEKSKFGLHAQELLQLIDKLKAHGQLDALKLMHFHMGSQIANIHDIKTALTEAGQFFVQLSQLGAGITIVDAGGGLGVDYEGSRSRRDCSMNYGVEEYAHNIVRTFAELCLEHQLTPPDILTESGRALTAHHAVLITQVTDIESPHAADVDLKIETRGQLAEIYHDAQFDLSQAHAAFVQGTLSLPELAAAEQTHTARIAWLKNHINPNDQIQAGIFQELKEKLADKIFCNFSLFQSLPDIWGIDQIFPILPIHRLNEAPTRRGVIQDLTCDSDGRIDHYIDNGNIESTLPIHAITSDQPYLIGFFMIGAYQEILGDMHNLFGDTHTLDITLTETGYYFSHQQTGEQVRELLDYVHIDSNELMALYQARLEQHVEVKDQRQQYLSELEQGLNAYTYLEKS